MPASVAKSRSGFARSCRPPTPSRGRSRSAPAILRTVRPTTTFRYARLAQRSSAAAGGSPGTNALLQKRERPRPRHRPRRRRSQEASTRLADGGAGMVVSAAAGSARLPRPEQQALDQPSLSTASSGDDSSAARRPDCSAAPTAPSPTPHQAPQPTPTGRPRSTPRRDTHRPSAPPHRHPIPCPPQAGTARHPRAHVALAVFRPRREVPGGRR